VKKISGERWSAISTSQPPCPADPSFRYHYEHFYSKFESARKGLYNNQVPWLKDPLAVSGALAMTLEICDPDAKKFFVATIPLGRSRLAIVKPLGWFGIMPDNARVGDWICIFEGGKVPFVVQREGRYEGVFGAVSLDYYPGVK
jgi:hypothetical protein